MNIYSTVDFLNLDKLIILFYSVLENSSRKNDLNFYILTDKISGNLPYIPKELDDKLKIREINLNTIWENLLENFNLNFYQEAKWCKHNMNFCRFLFFKIFPEVDRVIYLDWDMVVLKDIFLLEKEYNDFNKMIVSKTNESTVKNSIFTEKFRMSTSTYYLARKIKPLIDYKKFNLICKPLNIKVDDLLNTSAFNAGFFIISKKHFQEDFLIKHIGRLIIIQEKLRCFNFGTQVVMNLMNLKDRFFIKKEWNHLPDLEIIDKINNIHYNGIEKPWNKQSKENDIWFKYCKKVYPDWKYQNNKVEDEIIVKTQKEIKKKTNKINSSNNNQLILKKLLNKH